MGSGTELDVTALLLAISKGELKAREELIPLVYNELRNLARGQLRGERDGHTLDPTALVHEVYQRLVALPNRDCRHPRIGHQDDCVHIVALCYRPRRGVPVAGTAAVGSNS